MNLPAPPGDVMFTLHPPFNESGYGPYAVYMYMYMQSIILYSCKIWQFGVLPVQLPN